MGEHTFITLSCGCQKHTVSDDYTDSKYYTAFCKSHKFKDFADRVACLKREMGPVEYLKVCSCVCISKQAVNRSLQQFPCGCEKWQQQQEIALLECSYHLKTRQELEDLHNRRRNIAAAVSKLVQPLEDVLHKEAELERVRQDAPQL